MDGTDVGRTGRTGRTGQTRTGRMCADGTDMNGRTGTTGGRDGTEGTEERDGMNIDNWTHRMKYHNLLVKKNHCKTGNNFPFKTNKSKKDHIFFPQKKSYEFPFEGDQSQKRS